MIGLYAIPGCNAPPAFVPDAVINGLPLKPSTPAAKKIAPAPPSPVPSTVDVMFACAQFSARPEAATGAPPLLRPNETASPVAA